jgi:hypothetical protein
LKMFEYFAFGIPVVSTPLIQLWEYKDLIYLGDTARELASGIEAALREPLDSPKRAARIETARGHSLENLARVLRDCLPLDGPASPSAACLPRPRAGESPSATVEVAGTSRCQAP